MEKKLTIEDHLQNLKDRMADPKKGNFFLYWKDEMTLQDRMDMFQYLELTEFNYALMNYKVRDLVEADAEKAFFKSHPELNP